MGKFDFLFDRLFDGFDLPGEFEPKEVRCRYCGGGFLHWIKEEGKWVLRDGKENRHQCMKVRIINDVDTTADKTPKTLDRKNVHRKLIRKVR